ncbi:MULTISPECIES: hypothetical protein [unclassified Variovorax]|uniref:hypothetical protein n=1 Tax=unclassified Variovorax TaxID=663243 RepID=UPI003F460168
MGKLFTWLGSLGTLAYSSVLAYLIYRRWDALTKLPLNELGDFLAGAFGPLAILWLVLGYFQQGIELRINSDALKLQAKELANSVEQQRELVAVAQRQHETDLQALLSQQERHRQEREELHRTMQPNIAISVRRVAASLRSTRFIVTATNAGATCTQVQMELATADGERDRRSLDVMSQGKSIESEFTVAAATEVRPLLLTLEYVSLHGEKQKLVRTIEIVFPTDGIMTAQIVKPISLEDV